MKVEFMIYIYGAVCASMIVFNIIYNLLLKGSESRMQNRCQNGIPSGFAGGYGEKNRFVSGVSPSDATGGHLYGGSLSG